MARLFGQRWQIVEDIGQGGQAFAYLVTDVKGNGDTQYALKRLKNSDRIARFRAEVEAIRNLSHPNIMRLVDFDVDADPAYIVSEYCAGGTLEDAQPFWNNSPETALELFGKIVDAVAYAHENRVVHRDIKPANILLRGPGLEPVVADFGLCYLLDDSQRLTATSEAVGSRLYIAPELEDGRSGDVTPRCDVYSLGKILYWLLAGKQVFAREKHREQRFDLRDKNPQWFLGYGWNNSYLEHVNRLLDRMIVANPDKRVSSDHLSFLVRDTIRLIRGRYNPVGRTIGQLCTYCGQGRYFLQPENSATLSNMGFNAVDPHAWAIMICESCGHVQFFRPNNAKNNAWWST